MGLRPTAAELFNWGKHDRVYENGVLIWEVLKCCCHNHELLPLPLVVVPPEKKRNPVLLKWEYQKMYHTCYHAKY